MTWLLWKTGAVFTRCFIKLNRQRDTSNLMNHELLNLIDDLFACRFDFFIVSQIARQGTVSPTSYNVIHDSTMLDPGKVQQFT